MNYNISTYKNDLIYDNELLKEIDKNKINIIDKSNYKLILFNNICVKSKIKSILCNLLLSFFDKLDIHKGSHILVVGIGNDNYTADALGPKVLKHIKVNAYLEVMGYKLKDTKVSALEPGVLGETGILTGDTIKSVVSMIKPDLVVLVDSLVSDNIDYINKCIEITDNGLSSSNGISGLEFDINKKTLGVPVLLIGVTTALLVRFVSDNGDKEYILSTKDVDKYVNDISILVGEAINMVIKKLK